MKPGDWYWCGTCRTNTEHEVVKRRFYFGVEVRHLKCKRCERINKMWK